MSTPEPIHQTVVARSGNYWKASCSTCGWVGMIFETKREAARDADEHALILARSSS